MLRRIEGKYVLVILGPGCDMVLAIWATDYLRNFGYRVEIAAHNIKDFIVGQFNIRIRVKHVLSTFDNTKVPVPMAVIMTSPTLQGISSVFLKRTQNVPYLVFQTAADEARMHCRDVRVIPAGTTLWKKFFEEQSHLWDQLMP